MGRMQKFGDLVLQIKVESEVNFCSPISSLVPKLLQVRDPLGVYLCAFLTQRLCGVAAPINLAPNYCSRARVIPGNPWLLTSAGGRSLLRSVPREPWLRNVQGDFVLPPPPNPHPPRAPRTAQRGWRPRSGDAARPGARGPRCVRGSRAPGGEPPTGTCGWGGGAALADLLLSQ